MKYDINNSRFAKLWDSTEGRQLISIILNSPELFKANFNFWRTKFSVDPQITERQSDGTANFSVTAREIEQAVMMDMRAPLGDSDQMDKKGLSRYTGSIPDFIAKGWREQAMEREFRQKMYEEAFGNDTAMIALYANDVLQKGRDAADMTLSNMAAQALSTGKVVWNHGVGIEAPLYKADIPAANFTNAGTVVWSDTTNCQLLDQMAEKERHYKEDVWGKEIPLIWEIPYTIFVNYVLKNAQVIEWVKNWRTVNEKPNLTNLNVTEEMFREAIADFPGVSPIVIVREKQRDFNGETFSVVSGWASGKAVLRPAGYAGVVKRASILDAQIYPKYGSSTQSRVFATKDVYTVMNTVLNNGNLKEWHTDVMMAAVPVLDEFLYHVIVDTTAAD